MLSAKQAFRSLAVAWTISCAVAFANPIMFAPNGDNSAGSVKCEVPIKSLGSLALINGNANIANRVISIKAGSEFSDTPRTVLVGSILRTEANVNSSPPSITGLALFLMGDMIGQIDDQTQLDTIFRKDGHTEGRIMGIENESLSIKLKSGQLQSIPLSAILYIRSPRVFVFKIGLKSKQALQKDTEFQAESTEVSFRTTASARTLSGSIIPQSDKQQDDGMGILNNVGAGMSGVAGMNVMNGASGLGGMNTFGGPGSGSFAGVRSAVPDPRNDSFDNGDDANRFSTIRTKWGVQKLTVPPGILE